MAGCFEIKVLPPLKTATRYEFRCLIQPARSRVSRLLNRAGAPGKSSLRFGYRARNFEIPHHEIWDGFYPLIALTRHGGPLFDTGHDEGRIRFTLPISAAVRDFFIRRAADNGIHIEVEAELREMCFHRPASGDVLAFGGGKDSRLILGMLREQGVDPTIVTARAEFASDLPGALVVEPIQPRLINRIMPSFMQLGCRLYYGGGLGESHRVTPWHEYYDMASSRGRHELSGLLAALGADTETRGPVVVLPLQPYPAHPLRPLPRALCGADQHQGGRRDREEPARGAAEAVSRHPP